MISEKVIQMQKKVCLCFIDYKKAFDQIRHKVLFELLGGFDLFGMDI